MKSRDLVTLKMSSEGGQAVVADLAKVKGAIMNLRFENDGLRDSVNKTKGEIAATRKEITQYGRDIAKNEKIVQKAVETNQSLQAKMDDLEEAGKGNSKQFQNLTDRVDANIRKMQEAQAEIAKYTQLQNQSKNKLEQQIATRKEYSDTMDANKTKISELESGERKLQNSLKLHQLSVSQLRERYSTLKKARDGVSKSLYPEKWQKLDDQLKAVEKQLERVSEGGKKTNDTFSRMKTTVTKVITLMTVYAALRVFQNALRDIREFIREAPKVAAKSEGIRKAFKKLNDTKLLSNLRTYTKGLVNDVELMKASVKASNFGIPIQNLGKYLKFAQQRAQETGESVDYLVTSIINGIGRKSPLILDNLGISAARLKKEMSGGADIVQATTKIVEEELEKQGDLALTTADKATQASVKWENAQLKLGQRMTWLSEKWHEISGRIADSVAELAGDVRNANEVHEDQLKLVADLNVNTEPLIARYEELSKTVKINKNNTGEFNKEEEELLGLINQIRTSTNAAALEWDDHGRIIKINTQSAKDYITVQRNMLEFTNAEAIAYQKKNQLLAQNTLRLYENRLASGGYEQMVGGSNVSGAQTVFVRFSDKQRTELENAISAEKKKISDANKTLEYLDGTYLDNRLEKQEDYIKRESIFREMGKEQLDSWVKAHEKSAEKMKATDADYLKATELNLKEQVNLAKQIYKDRFGSNSDPDEETESKRLAKQKKELDTILTNQENNHKKELQLLHDTKLKEKQTDDEYKILVAKSDKKYYSERIKNLQAFRTKVTDEQFLADIDKQITDASGKEKEQDPIVDQANVSKLAKSRDELLRFEEVGTNKLKRIQSEREENEKVHALRLQTLELSSAQSRLEILRGYSKDVQELEIADGLLKEQLVRDANDAVIQAETELIGKRKALDKTYTNTNKETREKHGNFSVSEQMENEKAIIQAYYNERLISEETFYKALVAITSKYENEKLQVREQYNIASVQEMYENDLEQLRLKLEQELLTEEEFEEAKWQLKLQYATEFTQKINQLTGMAVNMGNALQEAATAKLESEYALRIAAAEGNAAEQERLEAELAQKKLDIEKEYADVQFAIKASEIIASTAVAIMVAYKQLGPIMGSVAAAMLGVTGAAQLVTANAERQKVKALTLGGSNTSGGGSGRVIVGKEVGGYMDVTRQQDGKYFKAKYDPNRRGYVDRPTVIVGEGRQGESMEYVINNKGIKNPTLRPIIDLIDYESRKGTIGTVDMNQMIRERLAGFESGGSISPSSASSNYLPTSPIADRKPSEVELEMLALLRQLRKPGAISTDLHLGSLKKELSKLDDNDNRFTLSD